MRIAVIPIDNRPVCYNLLKEIVGIDKSIELFMPDKGLLGGLSSSADVEGIFRWLDKLENIDAFVIALDTIAYGGLIPSRRSKDTFDEIKARLEKFKLKLKGNVYAFSSIMRISNNNVNEEEKEYWSEYGTKIFEYSYSFHKDGLDSPEIPGEIIGDYLATRHRNLLINKMYLQWMEEGIFNTLVFSKDDCAEYGFNVLEAGIIDNIIKEKKSSVISKTALIKTGADEIPLTLLARAVSEYNGISPKIAPKFLAPEYKNLVSNYEDISIEKCVQAQIELAGGSLAEEDDTDMILVVNNFEEIQGEIVMSVKTQHFAGQFNLPKKPYMVADVRFANGADNIFIDKLFRKSLDLNNFYGYSGWNTSANTLGSLVCAGIVRFFAKEYQDESFRKLQMARFLDDWAYQANARQALKGKQAVGSKVQKNKRPDVRKLQKVMQPFEKKVGRIFGIKSKVKYKFPWKRFFEVEVTIK